MADVAQLSSFQGICQMVIVSSLSEQIEEAIKDEIVSGRLAAGQRLSIDELAARWGVSSMPVRDAVKRLETVGFVDVAPRRGVFVSAFGRERFKNILDVRMALECLAVELATPLIPEEEIERVLEIYRDGERQLAETGSPSLLAEHDHLVHDLIVQHCGNPKLVELMTELRDLIEWGHQIISSHQPRAVERALPEHLRILEALQQRDVEAAQEALRLHLKGTIKRTMEAWQQMPES
jgi:DNA-binding GntR family transcriptional regulator